MERTYNQQQYERFLRRKTKCRTCHKPIVWMRTVDGRNIAVNPLKVCSTTPGEQILEEDGIIVAYVSVKVGWTLHQCQHGDRRMGGMLQDGAPVEPAQSIGR